MKHPSHRLLPSLTEQRGSRLPKSPQLVLSHLRQDTQSLSGVYRSLSSTPSPLCSRQGQLTVDPQFCRRSQPGCWDPAGLITSWRGLFKRVGFQPFPAPILAVTPPGDASRRGRPRAHPGRQRQVRKGTAENKLGLVVLHRLRGNSRDSGENHTPHRSRSLYAQCMLQWHPLLSSHCDLHAWTLVLKVAEIYRI